LVLVNPGVTYGAGVGTLGALPPGSFDQSIIPGSLPPLPGQSSPPPLPDPPML
jgi:hypothetical protein